MMVTPNIRLDRELGRGGMGAVWSASHLTLDSRVAVKFIAAELLEHSQDALARFQKEGRAVARIRSPHVVQVFDLGVLGDGTPFIVMELLDGESLEELLDRNRRALSPSEALPILEQVGKALEHAHAAGIVHRDIKPANIFLTRSGIDLTVKVLDFGIAKQTSLPQVSAATATGTMMGTPEYMSPEQVVSAKDVDYRADLWAFAVVAYELLVGSAPFVGETLGALIVAITRHAYAPPSARVPILSLEVDGWFERSFAQRVEARFTSANEMTAEFVRVCGAQPASRRAFPDTLPFRASPQPNRDASSGTVPGAPMFADPQQNSQSFGLQRLVDSESLFEAGTARAGAAPVLHGQGAPSPTLSGASSMLPGASRPKPALFLVGAGVVAVIAGGAYWAARDGDTARLIDSKPSASPAAAVAPTSLPIGRIPLADGIVAVAAGDYIIGCSPEDHRCFDDEKPPYHVSLAAFGVMVHEVTASEYDACVLNGRCGEAGQGADCTWRKPAKERMPITCVTQQDARDYCTWKGLALPTEAQWEVAARGRTGGDFPWSGETIDCGKAAVEQGCGSKGPLAVGSKDGDVSHCGARDMAGNVREWTSSQYTAYPGGKVDPNTKGVVNRGASWVMSAKDANTLHTRGVDTATERRPDLGFRCVKP